MTRAVPKSEYIKVECIDCGRELVVTKRSRNRQCQKCYNLSHDKKIYWKEGGEDELQSEQD